MLIFNMLLKENKELFLKICFCWPSQLHSKESDSIVPTLKFLFPFLDKHCQSVYNLGKNIKNTNKKFCPIFSNMLVETQGIFLA